MRKTERSENRRGRRKRQYRVKREKAKRYRENGSEEDKKITKVTLKKRENKIGQTPDY